MKYTVHRTGGIELLITDPTGADLTCDDPIDADLNSFHIQKCFFAGLHSSSPYD